MTGAALWCNGHEEIYRVIHSAKGMPALSNQIMSNPYSLQNWDGAVCADFKTKEQHEPGTLCCAVLTWGCMPASSSIGAISKPPPMPTTPATTPDRATFRAVPIR